MGLFKPPKERENNYTFYPCGCCYYGNPSEHPEVCPTHDKAWHHKKLDGVRINSMGYNLTKTSFLRNKDQLDLMLKSQGDVGFPTNDPSNLAYKIREAIKAALAFEDLKEYHRLDRDFIIQEVRNAVWAKFVGSGPPIIEDRNINSPSSSRQVDAAQTLIDVLATMAEEGDSYTEFYFPNVQLSETDKLNLWAWTKEASNLKWKFIDSGEKGITLTLDDVPKEVLWEPRESPTQ